MPENKSFFIEFWAEFGFFVIFIKNFYVYFLGNDYILEVSSSMEEDMGTYDVICENEFGQKRSNCFVTIIK